MFELLRPKSVQTKLLVLVSGLLCMATFVFYIFSSQVQRHHDNIHDYIEARTLTLFERMKELKTQTLTFFVYDYSFWNETITFLSKPQPNWGDSNLLSGMKKVGGDGVVLWDMQGKVHYQAYTKKELEGVETLLNKTKILSKNPQFRHFFVRYKQEIVECFLAPLHYEKDVKRQEMPQGYLMAFKLWDKSFKEELKKDINANFTITFNRVTSNIDGLNHTFLYNEQGDIIASISVDVDTPFLEEVMLVLEKNQLLLSLMTVIFIISLSIAFYILIARPLKLLQKGITHQDKKLLEPFLGKNDEYGEFATFALKFIENNYLLEQYKKALDCATIISKTDNRGIITYANEAFCEISGYQLDELIGKNHNIIRHPDTPKMVFSDMWHHIRQGEIWRGIIQNRCKNGSSYYVNTTVVPLFNQRNVIQEFIAIRTDITELYRQMQIIKEQTTDPLTGFHNRQKMTENLGRLESAKMALINIDRFRDINDSYGHDVGDVVLQTLAMRLREFDDLRFSFYRVHGDEFGILADKRLSQEEFYQQCMIIIETLEREPIKVVGTELYISLRCGIAYGGYKLYIHAEMALRYAKERKVSLITFDESINYEDIIRKNIEWTRTIKEAIEQHHVIPFGQKIFSVNDKSYKYECLMRIYGGEGKYISPYYFLEHAKKARLYDKLTQMMLQKIFEFFRHNDDEFSINFTVDDIMNQKTSQMLLETASRLGMGERITIEIVESEGIENFQDVSEFIKKAKALGMKIGVDDFGTGYSNFEYLIKLEVDYIKIDGSLIKAIDTDQTMYYVVRSIVEFARYVGMKTVAEFVHNQSVHDKCIDLGIDYLQGYYLDEPKALVIDL